MIDMLKQPKTNPRAGCAVAVAPASNEDRVQAVLAAFARPTAKKFPAWLQTICAAAAVDAAKVGFPTIRDEEWKFTNMAPLLQLPLHPAQKSGLAPGLKDISGFTFGLDCYRLVFVDGYFCARLSSLPGKNNDLQLGSLAEYVEANPSEMRKHLTRHASGGMNFFTALNTAYFQDGAFVSIAAGKTADKPVHLLFIGASEQPGSTSLPRNLILAASGAELKIIESHVSLSDAPRVANGVTELALGPNARVEHCRVQQESEQAFHVATVQAVLSKDSRWTSHSISLGARVARNQIQARFEAEGGEAILNGLYLGGGDQLVDHHTVVDHAVPHCASHEFYHGVMDGRAHGVFNGKIFVRKDAQKTDAKQTNRNLLLSDTAMIDTKPQLEIFADDVKCTHGATVGQLSDESLFYLQARGIGVENARRMLIQAFASGVIERIGIAPVRAYLEERLAGRFLPAQK
jgi:Fe-S cluster assembly protein SufD